MTAAELKRRCENRNFDRIVVVVRDIFAEMAELQRVWKVSPGLVWSSSDATTPLRGPEGTPLRYDERCAAWFYANTELCIIQPGEGDTVYRRFLDRFGEGICCVRERVSPTEYEAQTKRFAALGLRPVQTLEQGEEMALWLDLTAELGILYQMTAGGAAYEPAAGRLPERISQVNISTPDLQKTVETLASLLEIGPWEVGRQCNAVVSNPAFRVNGELRETEFSFLLGILVCGNIEWEVIMPEKGPLVYNDFIARRGIGFHHVLMEIPQAKWAQRLAQYASDGIAMACKGTLGPADWCYMDTEKELKFYTELRTDAVMEKLPDGYVQYFYPAN